MNVLSLFDGMSCGQIALERVGIKVDEYYASEIDKYAIQVTKYNYPNTIHIGDVTKWRDWNIDWASIDLVTGGFPCTSRGSKIKTITGYKKVEDIKKGDLVLTHNNIFKKVLLPMSKTSNHINTIYTLGNKIELTDEHPVYVYDKGFFKWIEVKELTTSDYLVYNINKESKDIELSDDELWLVGRYLADGVIDSNDRLYYCINNIKKNDFISHVLSNYYICHKQRNCQEIYIKNENLLKICKDCGKGAINKQIPQYIIDLPKNRLKLVLDGYLSGDGHFDKKVKRWMFTTVSENLYLGLQEIILKVLNKTPALYIRKDKRKETFNDTYNGQWYNTQKDSFMIDDKLCVRIKKINREIKDIDVYNFEVDIDNSYTINNLIVHNCQAWSLAGKQLGDKDERGKLFWVMLDVISNVLKHNPNAKFLMENVKMKREFEEYITLHTEQALGKVNKHLINSSLVSAQNRNRYYWTNIDGIEQPKDKGLVLKDILEDSVDKSHYISDSKYKFIERNGVKIKNGKKSPCLSASFWKQGKQECTALIQVGIANDIKGHDSIKRIYDQEGKYPTLTTCESGHRQSEFSLKFSTSNNITNVKKGTSGLSWFIEQQIYSIDFEKTRTLKAGKGSGNIPKVVLNEEKMLYRKLTPIECERLQTVDDNYTAFGIDDIGNKIKISNTQRYKMLGNGWTVDVIAHIFKNLKQDA